MLKMHGAALEEQKNLNTQKNKKVKAVRIWWAFHWYDPYLSQHCQHLQQNYASPQLHWEKQNEIKLSFVPHRTLFTKLK